MAISEKESDWTFVETFEALHTRHKIVSRSK